MLSGIRQNKEIMKSVLRNFLPLVLKNHFWREDQVPFYLLRNKLVLKHCNVLK